jgi:hypothetical protein
MSEEKPKDFDNEVSISNSVKDVNDFGYKFEKSFLQHHSNSSNNKNVSYQRQEKSNIDKNPSLNSEDKISQIIEKNSRITNSSRSRSSNKMRNDKILGEKLFNSNRNPDHQTSNKKVMSPYFKK